jgi:hypothetical protein
MTPVAPGRGSSASWGYRVAVPRPERIRAAGTGCRAVRRSPGNDLRGMPRSPSELRRRVPGGAACSEAMTELKQLALDMLIAPGLILLRHCRGGTVRENNLRLVRLCGDTGWWVRTGDGRGRREVLALPSV